MSNATDFVKYALSIGALELIPEGRKLKSGRLSPYFFNSGLFYNGNLLRNLAQFYGRAVSTNPPDVIFGPAYKGIPLAVAVSVVINKNVGYAFNRKEEKDHGEGGSIVGASLKGKKVGLLDDVMTTGGSLVEAFDIVQKAGGIPIWCAIAFDRQERADTATSGFSAVQEFENKYKIPVVAVANLSNLVNVLQTDKDTDNSEIIGKIIQYRDMYGAQM